MHHGGTCPCLGSTTHSARTALFRLEETQRFPSSRLHKRPLVSCFYPSSHRTQCLRVTASNASFVVVSSSRFIVSEQDGRIVALPDKSRTSTSLPVTAVLIRHF